MSGRALREPVKVRPHRGLDALQADARADLDRSIREIVNLAHRCEGAGPALVGSHLAELADRANRAAFDAGILAERVRCQQPHPTTWPSRRGGARG